jgi:hypothetical protein
MTSSRAISHPPLNKKPKIKTVPSYGINTRGKYGLLLLPMPLPFAGITHTGSQGHPVHGVSQPLRAPLATTIQFLAEYRISPTGMNVNEKKGDVIFLQLDILGQKMIAFDRSQSLGGLCQGYILNQAFLSQLADPRGMRLGHPQNRNP